MNKLETLRNLVQKMKNHELRSVMNFLKYYSDSEKSNQLKSVELITLIRTNDHYTSAEIQKTIYGKINSSAFNKLISRLYDKILEVLIFDSNINSEHYSERNKTIFDLRKKMIQVDLLTLRGMTRDTEKRFNNIIRRAKKFEVYDVMIQALYSKQRFFNIRNKPKYFIKLRDEIETAEKCWTAYNRSISSFNLISNRINFAGTKKDYDLELMRCLESLLNDYQTTKSPTIGYYYYYLSTDKYQNERKYLAADNSLNLLTEVIVKNPSVYTNSRNGANLLNIANNKIFLHAFDQALEYAKSSQNYLRESRINLALAKEMEFFAQFYNGNIIEALKVINELHQDYGKYVTPLMHDKYNYLMAAIHFIQGQFQKSIELFNSVKEIEKDKEGWNIGKRIMIILNRIELQNYESSDLHVQNLDKFIKRLLKEKVVRPRLLVILRILLKLINEGFNYQKVYDSRKRYFEMLASTQEHYSWEIKSPELIIFDAWFRAKMKHQNYYHAEVMKHANEVYSDNLQISEGD